MIPRPWAPCQPDGSYDPARAPGIVRGEGDGVDRIMPAARIAKLLVVVIVVAATCVWLREGGGPPGPGAPAVTSPAPAGPAAVGTGPSADGARRRNDDEIIERAFRDRRSDVMVESEGRVTRLLPDDDDGAQHQRFIVRLGGGHTLLVAHNIDLAPRVPLAEGDTVRFRGAYEWNDRGGVLHWTHRDPGGRREGGWLELDGRRYE